MPQAGDIKWTRNGVLSTVESISEAAQVAEDSTLWIVEVMNNLINDGDAATIFDLLIVACGTVGAVYFANYQEELEGLLADIKTLKKNETFYIAQRFRWHAGHRSWQPQNIFKVIVVDSNGNVIREIL